MGRFSCFQPLARNSKTKKSCRHSLEALHERVLQVNGSSRSSLESISVEERNEKLQVDSLSPPSVDSTMPTTTVEAIPEKVQVNGLRQPSMDSTMPNSADPVHMKLQVNGLSRPSVDSTTPTTSEEALPETVQVNGLSHPSADLVISSSSSSLTLNSGGTQINNEIKDGTGLVPVEPVCNSEEMNSISKKSVSEVRRTACLKKIKSTGCDNQWRIAYADDVTEDETDSNCLCDSHRDQYRLLGINDDGRVDVSRSSIFSIADAHENSGSPITNESIGDSNGHKMLAAAEIPKSHSKPSTHPLKTSAKCVSLWRSCNDLRVLDTRQDASSPEFDNQARSARDHGCVNCKEAHVDDVYDSYNRAGVARDWIMPVCNEPNLVETREGECSIQCRDELAGVDFKIKRIEEWMNDLQHCDPLEKSNESSESTDLVSRDTKYPPAKLESPQVTAGTEAAASYMSAPSANATSAQFVNQGLVAIPFLSAFSSLKVLNLSGNAIVRINAGNLPRGLHILNLSKNSISTIEGLRELTRLRVLDLSYNRIIRIGHGLASCSSLKELYLAGNKISEVEGLHRVLKLNLLDLRYNKISTANCLGQLAANYGSLQAINLEGNPAQKNVGDEHLKKFLQSLLPRLAYYNRQPIKAGILKCTGERKIVKLGPSSHPFDCSSRIDKTSSKKGGPASSCRKLTTSHSVELRNDVQLPTRHSKREP